MNINFLPVGHTHEDVDQFFGCIARELNVSAVGSIEALVKLIERCFTPKPKVSMIYSVADTTSWLKPFHIDFTGITRPYCFLLARKPRKWGSALLALDPCVDLDPAYGVDNTLQQEAEEEATRFDHDRSSSVTLQYKAQSFHGEYLPAKGLAILKKTKLPEEPPKQVIPRPIMGLTDITAYVQLCQHRIDKHEFEQMMHLLTELKEAGGHLCAVCKDFRVQESLLYTGAKQSEMQRKLNQSAKNKVQKELKDHVKRCELVPRYTGAFYLHTVRQLSEEEQKTADAVTQAAEEAKAEALDPRDYTTLFEAMDDINNNLMSNNKQHGKKSVQRAPKAGDMAITENDNEVERRNGKPWFVLSIVAIYRNNYKCRWFAPEWEGIERNDYNYLGNYQPEFFIDEQDERKQVEATDILERGTTLLDWGFQLTVNGRVPVKTLKIISEDGRCEWDYSKITLPKGYATKTKEGKKVTTR